jgi:hypothetical protein
LSTSRIAFLVTSPISRITPIILIMFSVSPVMSSAAMTPASDSGSDSMMAIEHRRDGEARFTEGDGRRPHRRDRRGRKALEKLRKK